MTAFILHCHFIMSKQAKSYFYTCNDQTQCHYVLWPHDSSEECCVFLHGFTNDAHMWDFIAPQLQQKRHVITVDFRGHGDSAWAEEASYTHEQLCQDVLTLIQQLPFKRFHIIGHSLGARIAMLLLARHKELPVESLVIIDTGPEVRAVGVNKVRKDAESAPTQFASQQAFYDYLAAIYLFANPERLKHLAYHGVKPLDNGLWQSKTDPAFTTALWKPGSHLQTSDDLRYPLNEELWTALKTLHCKTLILRGQASAILARKTAEAMQASMQNAELVTISRAGHALMVDNPKEFEAAVLEFIR